MTAIAAASHHNPHVQGRQWPFNPQVSFRADLIPPPASDELSIRVLRTEAERSAIKALRRYAPIDAERDLNADLDDLEDFKDSLGVVVAVFREDEAIATIRAIPSGHGVTLAEKSWIDMTQGKAEYGKSSWEVGRLIVAPEHRNGELLSRCLALALRELIKVSEAQYLHASCSPLMARLYRRFGFSTERLIQGENGLHHALILARVGDVSRAFARTPANIPRFVERRTHLHRMT